MAITRLFTLTAELQTVNDLIMMSASPTPPVISTTRVNTGAYSYRMTGSTNAFGRAVGTRSAIRAGYWLNHRGLVGSGKGGLFTFGVGGVDSDESYLLRVYWDDDTGTIKVERATALSTFEQLASATVPTSLLTQDSWSHVSCTYYCHATLGFLVIRSNGVIVLSLNGDTRLSAWNGVVGGGSAQIFSDTFNAVYVGGRTTDAQNGWSTAFAYLDDAYVDTYDSEVDAPVPARRFLTRIANGAGVDAAWTPFASTNVSQIDDGAPNGGPNDGDTTYNKAASVNLRDTFTKDPVTIPTGYRIVGMIPFAHTKTLDVGPEISLHLWDGANYADSADIVPPFSYTVEVAHRFSTMPDASSFSEAGVNGLSVGYRSRGTFV